MNQMINDTENLMAFQQLANNAKYNTEYNNFLVVLTNKIQLSLSTVVVHSS